MFELSTPRFRALLNQCIHCGLCLPACPTYALFGTEMETPRGRITLMRAVADRRIRTEATFRKHIELCLDCRACEPACPSAVQVGALVAMARVEIGKSQTQGFSERTIRRVALRELMPHHRRLRLIARAMRVYQRMGLQSIMQRRKFLPKRLQALETLLPPLPTSYPDYRRPAPAIGEQRGTVAFFRGCIQDAFLVQTNVATIRVLQQNGYQVDFPVTQTCCGAAQLHLGEDVLACELARKNIDAFLPSTPASSLKEEGYSAIISNAGGCGALLKDYARLLKGDAAYAERAMRFSAMVKDISEFLVDHWNVPPRGPVHVRATVVDSCHLRNIQKVIRQPRDLLTAIPGLNLVELAHPDRCCGSAGVYNILQVETATALLDAKMADIEATGADTIVVSNTGCHLHVLNGVRRKGLAARVVHLVELLDQSYTTDA